MSNAMTKEDIERLMKKTERDLNMGVFQAAWGSIASLFHVTYAGLSLAATVATTERNYATERYLQDKVAELNASIESK